MGNDKGSQAYVLPPLMTLPCGLYHMERFNLTMFIGLSGEVLPKALDGVVKQMAESIDPSGVDPAFREQWERDVKYGAGATREMLLYERLAAEMYVTRAVGNFLAYLSELLTLVFQARPETLGESSVTVKEVLEYGTPEALVAAAAERKVNDISQRGMRQLDDYFRRDHQMRLFKSDEEVKQAEYIRAVRNLIVHKRGLVDRKFLADVPDRKGKDQLGMKVELEEVVLDTLDLLDRTVDDIDGRIAKKYKLAQPITDKGFWQIIAQLRQMGTTEPPQRDGEGVSEQGAEITDGP